MSEKKKVIQFHHIRYKEKGQEEIVVPVFKGEHWAATNLDRRKFWSTGLVQHLFDRILTRMKNGTIIDLSKDKQ